MPQNAHQPAGETTYCTKQTTMIPGSNCFPGLKLVNLLINLCVSINRKTR